MSLRWSGRLTFEVNGTSALTIPLSQSINVP
jgi:hypothetical protein